MREGNGRQGEDLSPGRSLPSPGFQSVMCVYGSPGGPTFKPWLSGFLSRETPCAGHREPLGLLGGLIEEVQENVGI